MCVCPLWACVWGRSASGTGVRGGGVPVRFLVEKENFEKIKRLSLGFDRFSFLESDGVWVGQGGTAGKKPLKVRK